MHSWDIMEGSSGRKATSWLLFLLPRKANKTQEPFQASPPLPCVSAGSCGNKNSRVKCEGRNFQCLKTQTQKLYSGTGTTLCGSKEIMKPLFPCRTPGIFFNVSFYLFTYSWLHCCCARAFSHCSKQGLLSNCIAWAPECRLSSCDTQD